MWTSSGIHLTLLLLLLIIRDAQLEALSQQLYAQWLLKQSLSSCVFYQAMFYLFIQTKWWKKNPSKGYSSKSRGL